MAVPIAMPRAQDLEFRGERIAADRKRVGGEMLRKEDRIWRSMHINFNRFSEY